MTTELENIKNHGYILSDNGKEIEFQYMNASFDVTKFKKIKVNGKFYEVIDYFYDLDARKECIRVHLKEIKLTSTVMLDNEKVEIPMSDKQMDDHVTSEELINDYIKKTKEKVGDIPDIFISKPILQE
jgi:hypothetical protein